MKANCQVCQAAMSAFDPSGHWTPGTNRAEPKRLLIATWPNVDQATHCGAGNTSSAADIFVSYKAEDRAGFEPLVAALEAEGFRYGGTPTSAEGTHWRERHQGPSRCSEMRDVAWTALGRSRRDFVRDEATEARRRWTLSADPS